MGDSSTPCNSSCSPTALSSSSAMPHSVLPSQFYASLTFEPKKFVYGKMLGGDIALASKHAEASAFLVTEFTAFLLAKSTLDRQYARALSELSRSYYDRLNVRANVLSQGASASPRAQSDVQSINTTIKAWLEHLKWLESESTQRRLVTDKYCELSGKLTEANALRDTIRKKLVTVSQMLSSGPNAALEEVRKSKEHYIKSSGAAIKAKIKFTRTELEENLSSHGKNTKAKCVLEYVSAKNKYLLNIRHQNTAKTDYHELLLPWVLNEMEFLDRSRSMDIKMAVQTISEEEVMMSNFNSAHYNEILKNMELISCAGDAMIFSLSNETEKPPISLVPFESHPAWRDTPEVVKIGIPQTSLKGYRRKLRARNTEKFEEVRKLQLQIGGAKKLMDIFLGKDHLQLLKIVQAILDPVVTGLILNAEMRAIESEIELIDDAVGPSTAEELPHSFYTASFSRNVLCSFCHSSVFSLSKLNYICKICGIACHPRCEIRVAANCSGFRSMNIEGVTEKSMVGHETILSDSVSTFESQTVYADSICARSTICQNPTSPLIFEIRNMPPVVEANVRYAAALFDYEGKGPDEISIVCNQILRVMPASCEAGDSGWVNVLHGDRCGIVPASYVQDITNIWSPGKTLARATYDYAATTPEELDLSEGSFVDVLGLEIDGWIQVAIDNKVGDVPISYIEFLQSP